MLRLGLGCLLEDAPVKVKYKLWIWQMITQCCLLWVLR